MGSKWCPSPALPVCFRVTMSFCVRSSRLEVYSNQIPALAFVVLLAQAPDVAILFTFLALSVVLHILDLPLTGRVLSQLLSSAEFVDAASSI